MSEVSQRLGVVAIGRNEGERLRRCLESALAATSSVIYVDSGSRDDSLNMARALGVEVVELDMSVPFTAARARNEGYARLRDLNSGSEYVQFVDGDCEIVPGWLDMAHAFLEEHQDVAVVCGRRRERFPERSVYNLLCDIEWDTPIGQAKACGGDAMMRVGAFDAAQGFRADLIAGEEPELCVRLRKNGWKIWRLDSEMTLHDAAMLRFSQWWNRSKRAGFAYTEGAFLHGAAPERHWVRESLRVSLWGGAIPLSGLIASLLGGAGWALIFLVYPLQVIRLALKGRYSKKVNWAHAYFLVLGKFPEFLGLGRFLIAKAFGGSRDIIEYK